MKSHRALLALLVCFLLDAAMPFEPAARGGVQLEIEGQSEAGLCTRRRHAERPARVDPAAPRPPVLAAATAGRVAPAAHRPREVAVGAPRVGSPRARTHAPDPASSAEDH